MAEEREPGAVTPPPTGERTDGWWKVLLIGAALYFLSLGILVLTGNPNLFPTVIILGSSLVPAAYVAFLYERRRLSRLSMPTVGLTFFYGGVLGVVAAAALEPVLIDELTLLTAFLVGLIEEAAKILGVLVIARRRRHDTDLDGLILGAAAGMGFAALESAGYAFTAFVRSGGSLSLTTGIVVLRALVAPLGHGTWTAILAAVIFREGHVTHFHLDRAVMGAYLLVSGLHGLWNGLPLLLSGVLDGAGGTFGQLLVGGAGLYLLSLTWREAKRRQLERVEAEEAREE